MLILGFLLQNHAENPTKPAKLNLASPQLTFYCSSSKMVDTLSWLCLPSAFSNPSTAFLFQGHSCFLCLVLSSSRYASNQVLLKCLSFSVTSLSTQCDRLSSYHLSNHPVLFLSYLSVYGLFPSTQYRFPEGRSCDHLIYQHLNCLWHIEWHPLYVCLFSE